MEKNYFERLVEKIKKALAEGKTVIMSEGRSLGSWYLVCTDVKENDKGETFFYFRPAKISDRYASKRYTKDETIEYIKENNPFHFGEFKTDEEVEAFGKSKKRKVYFLSNDIRYPYCKAVTTKSKRYSQYKYNHIFVDDFMSIEKD